jgi:hypothetical protein|tara:strand:- start:1670 stop:2149 length:480 start_codon:yes stop_codon:yes gene_type:complete
MEKNMIIVLDDIFMANQLDIFRDRVLKGKEDFFLYGEKHINDFMCSRILERANNYIPLESSVGYEYWTQQNTRPEGKHQDKDEKAFMRGVERFPMCSIVFYLTVENLKDGKLVFDNGVEVTPVENRLVIFKKQLEHFVQPFKGSRVSVAVNPWETKLYK